MQVSDLLLKFVSLSLKNTPPKRFEDGTAADVKIGKLPARGD